MTDDPQPQTDSAPPPDPAPVQAEPAPIVTPDPRLINVKEFSEQPGMTMTGDGAPRDGGGSTG